MITTVVDWLVDQLRDVGAERFDIVERYAMMVFDIIGDLAFGLILRVIKSD